MKEDILKSKGRQMFFKNIVFKRKSLLLKVNFSVLFIRSLRLRRAKEVTCGSCIGNKITSQRW